MLYGCYVYGDVTDEEKNIVEEHISRCESCASEVDSLKETLQLLRLELEPSIPQDVMDNFETNVYKRIAAEMIPTSEKSQQNRRKLFADFWERFFTRPSFLLKTALIAVTLGIGILIGTLKVSQTPKIAEAPMEESVHYRPLKENIISTSSVERLEQHFQAESYRQLEDALLTRYVAGDELRAIEILNRLRDENPGQQITSVVARERSELNLKDGI